jgi:hypothetical protein
MIIKKILENKNSKVKFVVIPKNSDLKAGDYVRISKVPDKEDEDGNRDNNS